MSDKCTRCQKSVFPAEKPVKIVGAVFHESCFRCKQCNAKLTLKIVKTGGGDVYCESHDPARFAKNA
eukprot:m.221108 g.221108  ORF g.221108 m.221108 type:complete len:67 (+) comp15720_c0_seq1:77-277(+)